MEDAARAIFARANMPDVISWDEARARKVAAEAEMAEMELAKERGLLLPVEMVAEINENIFGVFRARMTALPAKAAPDVFSADSLTEAKTLLKQHINAALDELANSVVENAMKPIPMIPNKPAARAVVERTLDAIKTAA